MDSLETHDNITLLACWGAFLRAVRQTKRVGCYTHCVVHLCNAITKQLASDLLEWVAGGDGWGVIGHMQKMWSDIMQEAANGPLTDRVASRCREQIRLTLRPLEYFLEKKEIHKPVLELLKAF